MTYCDDCPDREACHQGMSCDLSRRFAFVADLYQQKMKGNTTMSSNQKNVTPADVAAKAAEEKLVVPAQGEGEDAKTGNVQIDPKNDGSPELKVIDGGKKSLKERLAEVTAKLKENKKTLIAVGAAASVAAVAFVKYAKKKAEETLVEAANEETVTEDVQTETTDDSAA